MRARQTITALVLLLLLMGLRVQAQVKEDSVKKEKQKKSLAKKAWREGLDLISTTPKDPTKNDKSENPFLLYSGKIIRTIHTQHIGFEKSIYDSTKKVNKVVADVSNFLHVNTREKTLRQHLFIKENEPLNPHKLADNERFLRDKDFILDCRIIPDSIPGTDSVDLVILTRDVFSIGGTAGGSPPSSIEFSVFDANLSGRGQRVEYFSLLEQDRHPLYGFGLLFNQSSIFGSLANLELIYTQINAGRSIGKENEYAIVTRLQRPLVSPYSRIAGGFEYSKNWSENVYQEADSTFLKYDYNVFDVWLGYNIGVNRHFRNRNRQFISVRYADGVYGDTPEQPEYKVQPKYNDQKGVMSEFTFYRQNFYRTQYVFGFGRTEDIPTGISASVTGGLIRLGGTTRLIKIDSTNSIGVDSAGSSQRPYGALKFAYAVANRKGNFYRATIQTSTFFNHGTLEDVILHVNGNYTTRALQLGRAKLRNQVSITYSQINNPKTQQYMKIPNSIIPGFSSDSVFAEKRLVTHLESALYLPFQLVGFKFSPFLAVDIVALDCTVCISDQSIYYGLSGGFRTRNENLIFGTMELKITYIPQNEFGESKVNIGFKQNLRVKNSGSFVRAPALIKYN
jgi:hypothetical protein